MCIGKIQTRFPDRTNEELTGDFGALIDEIVHALQRDAGLPTNSPLPGKSPTAMRYGAVQQSKGYAIEKLALDFGTICDSTGELASRDNLSFSADEYRLFNVCLDTAISSALEEFSNRALRQQDDVASQRVGFLAHELRNALSSARLAFAVLRRGQLGVVSKTGDILDRNLRRLESLVGQTLLALQLNAGVQQQPKRMRAGELLREAQESAVSERGIRVVVDVASDLQIDADETVLISAIGNLLQNAIKFTRTGGQVTIRAHRDDDDDVVIEVQDECGGLPPRNHEDLLMPLAKREADGRALGVGVATTRRAIEAHGGELSVRNFPGNGCVFAMKLPA